MQLSRILFLSFTCLLGLMADIHGQSAQDDRQQVPYGVGWQGEITGMNSLYREGVAVLDDGVQIMVKTWRVYDRLYREELSSVTGKLVIIATPSRGWISACRAAAGFLNP
jgi:hypothetical protein